MQSPVSSARNALVPGNVERSQPTVEHDVWPVDVDRRLWSAATWWIHPMPIGRPCQRNQYTNAHSHFNGHFPRWTPLHLSFSWSTTPRNPHSRCQLWKPSPSAVYQLCCSVALQSVWGLLPSVCCRYVETPTGHSPHLHIMNKCKKTVVYLQLITAKWHIENSKNNERWYYFRSTSPVSTCI